MSNARTERKRVTLPDGFDPAKHLTKLEQIITDRHGDGWEIDHIDPATGQAVATRQVAVTEVSDTDSVDRKSVRLPKGTKPSHGERMATRLEDQYDGYTMIRFEPHLGFAELAKLDRATVRARGAVANALRVKPWEVTIAGRADGGWTLTLPGKYTPSQHDDKLQEVASEIVGEVGWTFETNPATLEANIIPGEPPTFPPAIPYPFDQPVPTFDVNAEEWSQIPLGHRLGRRADDPTQVEAVDLGASPHMQLSGTTGSGKSVTLDALISGAVSRGFELVITDQPSKSVDFLHLKKFCRPGGWACDDLESVVTGLALVYKEGERRARLMKEHRATKWTELPADLDLRPILIIMDEVTVLFQTEEVPKGLPKDHPLVTKPTEINLLKATIKSYVSRITAEMRFAGLHMVLSSQVASTTTGVPTSIRLNLGQKVLLGARTTNNNRKLGLSDPNAVPKVPSHVAEDAKAAKGVGVSEFEGQDPGVFKSFFAEKAQFVDWLDKLDVPTNDNPAPTREQILEHSPAVVNDAADEKPNPNRTDTPPDWDPDKDHAVDPDTGEPLKGFAKANATRAAAAAGTGGEDTTGTCGSCDTKIDANGNCRCST